MSQEDLEDLGEEIEEALAGIAAEEFLLDLPLEDLPNPFEDWPWHSVEEEEPLRREEVAGAILRRAFQEAPYPGPSFGYGVEDWGRVEHIRRVAYLCVYKWTDPVSIDVHGSGEIELVDGHHRVAAARFRGSSTIQVEAGGFIDELEITEEAE